MAIKDPEIGVRAIVKDFDKYIKDLNQIVKQSQDANAKIAQASTQSGRATQALASGVNALTKAFGDGGLSGVLRSVVSSLPSIASGFTSIVGPAGMAAAGIAAVVVAGKEIVELGVHGALISGVEESFSRIAHVAGESADAVLSDMHGAAGGLISDFDLMRQANILFAGATKETARTLMQNMDELIEIARVQARATGGEVEYFFNSLVQGVKRAEPRLIDNTGLIIKVGEATKEYARQLGITTQEMTAEDKTIAILNATLEAGTRSVFTYADMTEQSRAQLTALTNDMESGKITAEEYADRLDGIRDSMQSLFADTTAFEAFQQLNVSIQEIKNDISQALEPMAKAILDFINSIVEPIRDFIDNVAPAFGAVFEVIGSIISGIGNAIGAVVRPLLDFVGGVLRNIAKGIIWVFHAVAVGIMYVANTFIFPAVIFILETLASWLEGESPPPAGPLKYIDKGAAKVMEAWLSGFTGVSLDPVTDVLNEVNAVMGDVTGWDRDRVAAALKTLDEALRPFDERLQLVKATWEEMKEPVDAAFRSIDRQLETAVKAMLLGDTQAAALVRQLDMQRQALQNYNKEQEATIDNAAIQLAYAKSQQALERQILLIQQSRLGPAEKEAAIKKLKEKAAKKGKEELTPRTAGTLGAIPGMDAEDFGFEADTQAFIDEALGFLGVGDTFTAQQALFDENREKISGLGTRIGKAFENSGLVKAFKGIGESIDKVWNETLKPVFDSIGQWLEQNLPRAVEEFRRIFESVFTGVGNIVKGVWEDGIKPHLDRFGAWLAERIPKAAEELGRILEGIFPGIGETVRTFWEDSVKPHLDNFGTWLSVNIPLAGGSLKRSIEEQFDNIKNIIGMAWNDGIKPHLDMFMDWLAKEIPWAAGELRRIVEEQFNNLRDTIELAWNDGIKPRLDDLINWLATEIPRAAEGLRNVFESVFNSIVNSIQKGIDKIVEFFNQVSQAGVDANIEIRNNPTPPNTYLVPNRAAGTLERKQYQVPKAYQFRAGGGGVSGGLDYLIGENGPELLRLPPGLNGWIDSNSVFKNKMMMSGLLGRSLAPSLPYPTMPSSSNSWQDDHSVNYGDINFNGIQDTSAAHRRFSMLRMMRR